MEEKSKPGRRVSREFITLVAAQLSAPLGRILFSFVIIPIHPDGLLVLTVLAISEITAIFLTFGRNYLVQSGYNHHIFGAHADKLVLPIIALFAFLVFSTSDQRAIISGVVVLSIAMSVMTMLNAVFLRDRYLVLMLPLNLGIYALVSLGPYMTPAIAVTAVFIWFLIESNLSARPQKAPNRFLPIAATLMAFISQRLDIQIAAITAEAAFLTDIFQLNTLFLPLALFVRIIANTALLRGVSILSTQRSSMAVLTGLGLLYTAGFYAIGWALDNQTMIDQIGLIAVSVVIAMLMIPYREQISMHARAGNFWPLALLSSIGILPSLVFFASISILTNYSVTTFIASLYVAPRLLMFIYCITVLQRVKTP